MHRRSSPAASATVLAASRLAWTAAPVLHTMSQASFTSIDPVRTTADITRNRGSMVYDTPYRPDGSLQPHPQMAADYLVGRYSSFTATRTGLKDRVNSFALFWNPRRI